MKRPLATVALLYAGGLLLGEHWQPPLTVLLPVSFLLAATTFLWTRARPFLLCPLIVFVGWSNLVSRTIILSPVDLRLVLNDEPALVTARGTLIDTPQQRVHERGDEERWRTLARLRVHALRIDGNWKPAHGEIAVTTPGLLPTNFFGGRTVEIYGMIAPPRGPLAEGLFDYRAYLNRKGVFSLLQARNHSDWHLIEGRRNPRSPPLSDRFRNWAQIDLARGLPEDDEAVRLLWAMTLGWKTALTGEVSEPFMRSGTLHIFAISGLHVALVAGILLALLRAARLKREWCGLIVIPLLWFYAGVTGWQPSAVRATVMMSVVLFGWSLKRPGDLLNSLFAAAFIILLWEPEQLFQASFQLSFSVVLSLALILPHLDKLRLRWLEGDPMLPTELRPRWQRWLGPPAKWVGGLAATSFAAWLGSLPLTAYYFHLFTPVSLLANILIVPISGLALASSMGSLLTGAWFPLGAEVFNHSGWLWMHCMMAVSQWASGLPAAYAYVPAPATALLALYYALLITISTGWLFAKGFWKPCVCLLAGLVLWNGWQWFDSRHDVRLTIIPLNGGSCIYVNDRPAHSRMLIDCGNSNSVAMTVTPFLHAQGVNRLPVLALTHGDVQYMGGANDLFDEFDEPLVHVGPLKFRSKIYRDFMTQLESQSDRRRVVQRGERIGSWAVLHPASDDDYSRADDGTLVLLGEFEGVRVLALSDLGRRGQEALLARHPELRADIIISGLPTQGEPIAEGLLDRIQPQLIIVEDSNYPATRRASRELMERLSRRNSRVVFTHETGGLGICFRPSGWELRGPEGEAIIQ